MLAVIQSLGNEPVSMESWKILDKGKQIKSALTLSK